MNGAGRRGGGDIGDVDFRVGHHRVRVGRRESGVEINAEAVGSLAARSEAVSQDFYEITMGAERRSDVRDDLGEKWRSGEQKKKRSSPGDTSEIHGDSPV